MRRTPRQKDLLNPERILANLLKDYVEGRLDNTRVLYRAVVTKVDQVGGVLEVTPPNPKNSIQARVITNGLNTYTQPQDLPVFWPLSVHTQLPIKEGEHVYVIFDDENKQHGLWVDRIAEPKNVDNVNYVAGATKYQQDSSNELSGVGLQQADQDVENNDAVPITVSPQVVTEEVPPLTARVSDHVIHGSNNAAIVLGRDRPVDVESGEAGPGTGTIDLVTGRADPENMNMGTDKSRIYISSKTDADGNFSINVGEGAGPAATIVVKSDQIRIVARGGMKLVVEGGNIHIDGAEILLGVNAEEAAVLGNKLVAELGKLIDALAAPPLAALGSVPLPPHPSFVAKVNAIKATLEQTILSQKNKVE